MEIVDPEDEPSAFREPPQPDDRLWRHPSEMAAGHGMPAATIGPEGRRDNSGRPAMWAVAGASALVATLVSTGLVVTLIGTQGHSPSSDVAVERQMVHPRTASTVSASPAVDMAERLRPSIVQLKVQMPDGSRTASGVVFRSDGHVLTNAHVVAGATAIRVAMANGRELGAHVVGADPETDTAVVKLDGGPFPVATLGTAVDLRVGQTTMAMGFPLALAGGPSMTGGMVSALHREITPATSAATQVVHTALVDMIQIDVPISPEWSGGALLDANGAVIGITTAMAPGDAGSGGFGFATTIDVARSVADELIRTGKVEHSWLGIGGGDLDTATAVDLNLQGGAMVGDVTDGSPAQRAGLAARDVIVAFDGHDITSMGDLVMALRTHAPGDTVVVKVVRDRRPLTATVVLVERPPTS
ncbi:MAG: S1C family serine protease [Actinomycetota bacterium]|nr:S1C family serine protease [Actinomycetota bacterium]